MTSREALNRISEFSEAGITVRGNYIPPGKVAVFVFVLKSRKEGMAVGRSVRPSVLCRSVRGFVKNGIFHVFRHCRYSGKEPKGEERKLYLAIESLNELAVDRAKLEIQRLIKEELVRLQNSYQPQSKGRYKLT